MKRSNLIQKKFYKLLLSFALVLFGVVLALNPARYCTACFEGICLWAECVLPSLFPFIVVSSLLCGLGAIDATLAPFKRVCKRFKINPAAIPLFILSAVSGYPAGSRLLSEYYLNGKISSSEAQTLAPLCSIPSPAFALSTVGFKAFGGGYSGVKLLFAAYLTVVLSGVIYALIPKKNQGVERPVALNKASDNLLYDSFYGAVSAVLTAGGFICFFYVLSKAVSDYNLLTPLTICLRPIMGEACDGLALGLVEPTGGIFTAAKFGGFFALPIAGFLLVFGGASILGQQLCYLTKCGVKPKSFVFLKFIQGLVAFIILCLLQLICLSQ